MKNRPVKSDLNIPSESTVGGAGGGDVGRKIEYPVQV